MRIADSAIDPGDYNVTIEYQDALDVDGDTVTVRLDRTLDVAAFKFDTYNCDDEYTILEYIMFFIVYVSILMTYVCFGRGLLQGLIYNIERNL